MSQKVIINEKVVLAIRILLGLGLVVFGLNKFIGFMPQPPAPADGKAFLDQLFNAKYVMNIAGAVYLAAGVSFLTNKFVPLLAIILFPILLNAFLYHARFDPAGIAGAAVFTALNIFVIVAHKPAYNDLLKP
ncbi:MAG: DoxX family protein [Aureispira sp.]